MTKLNVKDYRNPDYPIEDMILNRWSPRAMSGEPIDAEQLMSLFEAARWAPSALNLQDRFYLYAHRETSDFELFFQLLAKGNQAWCDKAAVLIVAFSDSQLPDGKPNPWHALDAGLAIENLLLQCSAMGLAGHPMTGFDAEKASRDLNVPERFVPQCMIAVGHPGDPSQLSEFNQAREFPNQRKPLSDFIREGKYQ